MAARAAERETSGRFGATRGRQERTPAASDGEAPWWSADADVQRQLHRLLAEAQAGRHARADIAIDLPDDGTAVIDFQLVPIVEDGTVTALVPSGVDITDRVAERDRLQALATREDRRVRYPELVRDTDRVGLDCTAALPLVDESGDVFGFFGVGWAEPNDFADELR